MDEVDFIRRALDDATELIETKYADRTELSHREKETSDRLTEADVEIQRLLVQHIGIHYPTDAIVGEESGFDKGIKKGPERCWIIDPIDGTYNFTRDLFPVFGISIACAERGLPIAAGIALPGLQQLYLARRGTGATCNGRPLQVSDERELMHALVSIDFSKPSNRHRVMKPNSALARVAGQVRAPGCAVVGLCAVASGRAEAHFDAGLEPWDIAAAALMVEESGGRVSRPDGRPLNLLDGEQGLLASNGHVHDQLLDRIRAAEMTPDH